MSARTWPGEPSYAKPDISVRAITLYHEIAAPIMRPFVQRRLLNLYRCREERCFFQRNRAHPPTGKEFDALVGFEPVAQKNGRTERYLFVETAGQIVGCARLQCVEFHGWGSRAGAVETPDRMVIDLDPDPALDFIAVRRAALQLRQALEALGLDAFALLTGGKGVHVVVPIVPTSWEVVRDFAKRLCGALAEAAPDRFTIALPKNERQGRIFLDFLRNQRTATAIMPYSARARPGMPVAAPVCWEELEQCESASAFTIADAAELLDRARSPALERWGMGSQQLPELG